MSRSNKPRSHRRHSYANSRWKKWVKENFHRRLRQEINQCLKDILFTDAFDEKELIGKKKAHFFNMWYYL